MAAAVRLYGVYYHFHSTCQKKALVTACNAATTQVSRSSWRSSSSSSNVGAVVIPCIRVAGSVVAVRSPTAGLIASLLSPQPTPALTAVRYGTNFFNKFNAQDLWRSVTSVSTQGAKKGRGKGAGRTRQKNLNRGQIIGEGNINMVWPGLNSPVARGSEILKRQLLPPDPLRQEKLIKLRDTMAKIRRSKLDPLDRGWSGTKMGGRKLGPPDPIGEDTFEGFESICLEFKIVTQMTGNMGRKRSVSVFSVTGNGNGVVGFALAKAQAGRAALRVSKNRAGQQLVYVQRYNEHTVMHDFFTEFGNSRIFVKKMHEGYGLVCHRAIKAICEVAGIRDLHAKVEGAVNTQNVTKAFFLGLMRQKSHQQLAEEKGLHLVEMRGENFDYPTVVASPLLVPVRTISQIKPNENLNFKIHVMNDRVALVRKKFPNFIQLTPGWQNHLEKYKFYRNHEKVRRELIKEYGQVRSFYYEHYPECIGYSVTKKDRKRVKDADDDDEY